MREVKSLNKVTKRSLLGTVLIVTLACVIIAGFTAWYTSQTIQDTSGEVIGIGISLNITDIDWGSLYPQGEGTPYSKNVTFEVTNDENYEVELTVTINDVSPSAFFDTAVVTSNINGTLVDEFSTEVVWLQLLIQNGAPSGDFSFDVIVSAETTL